MELAQLLAKGEIKPRGTPLAWLRDFVSRSGVAVRDVTVEIAAAAAHFPQTFPADPFDRLIAATALVHGRAAADQAAETARRTFEEGALSESLPTVEVPRADLDKGLGVLTAFAEKTGLVSSNGDARRQIKAGGLKVNDATVSDEKLVLSAKDLTPEGVIKLSLGKKKHILLKPI